MRSAKSICRLFSRLNIGGPSLHVVNLSVGLEKFGYETLLVVGSPDPSEGSMEIWARESGAQLRILSTFQAAISPPRDFVTFVQLLRLFIRERPAIVHTHTFKAGLLGRLAAWLTGVPTIVHTYHGHLLSGYWKGLTNQILITVERFLSKITTKVLAVSETVAQDLVKAKVVNAEKIEVVELGFDISVIEEQLRRSPRLRQDLGISPHDQVVGIVGRLVPIKAVDLFLRALTPLLQERPNLQLVIVGDGSEATTLKNFTGANPRIHFCGWRTPFVSDLPDLDLCVCSSRNEGTSVSIIEAVIAGVPVVCTAVGGMGDLLGQGRWGDLVPFDEMALRDRVRQRLNQLSDRSPESQTYREKSRAASEIFKQRFSVERLLREIDQLYSDLAPGASPAQSFAVRDR